MLGIALAAASNDDDFLTTTDDEGPLKPVALSSPIAHVLREIMFHDKHEDRQGLHMTSKIS